MNKKLSDAQQAIIDALRSGAMLRLVFYTKGPSLWVLYEEGGRRPTKTINRATIMALEKKGLVEVKSDYPKWPRTTEVILRDIP